MLFFFFKQKTAYEMRISDWSSDVCSSDLQVRREQRFAIGDGIGFAGLLQPGAAPGLFGGLDDEGREAILEAVGMYLEQAMFVGLEDEGEGIERQRRPEPDEAVAAPVEAGAETVLPVVAHQTVDAVGADQQVAVAAQCLEILQIGRAHV